MAFSSQTCRASGGRPLGASLLSALAALVSLSVGCQADITGSGAGSNDPGGNGPNMPPGTNAQDVPEPADWFGAVTGADCSKPAALARTRIRRLSNVQWKNTVTAALGADVSAVELPEDAISSDTGFNTDAVINKVNVQLANAYFDSGATTASAVAASALAAYPCLSTGPGDAACNAPFIKDVGQKLFRRPLADAEVTKYGTFLAGQAALDPADVAVASVIRAMLLSPSMVYITELGSSQPGEVALTPYEQASLLSYLIADVPPDAALLAAAQNNGLDNASTRQTQAQRLMQLPGARAKYADFWKQYLPLGDLRQAEGVDATLVAAIEDETKQHFDKIVWQNNGSFQELLTAPYTFGAQTLSAVYGSLTPGGMGGSLTLPAGQRSGFITQAGFLFVSAAATPEHKIIHRGLTVRKRLLCQDLPPPPANLMPQASDLRPLGEDATPLESYTAFQTAKPACAACHNTFQPIGLAFEQYDNLGKYRTAYENGKPIMTGGELADAGDASGHYENAVEIGQHIGQSKIGEYCFTRQFAEYALGRHINAAADACLIKAPSAAAAHAPIQTFAVALSDIQARTHRVHN
jgi:hypothetical protein